MIRHAGRLYEYLVLVIAVASWFRQGGLAGLTRRGSARRFILSAALLCNIGQVLGHEGLGDASSRHGGTFVVPQFHHLERASIVCPSDDSTVSMQDALSEASLHAPALLDKSMAPRFESPSELVASGSRNRLARGNPEAPERPPKA